MTQTEKLFCWRYKNSLIIVFKRISCTKRAIINRRKGACAVLYRQTFLLLVLNNLWEKIKECGEARRSVQIPSWSFQSTKERKFLFFSCNFNTFFQDFYSPGGSQSGGHVSIYFIYYLQFPSKMAVLFKSYPDK